jgi:hypothetical protein
MVCYNGSFIPEGFKSPSYIDAFVDVKTHHEGEFIKECKKYTVKQRDEYFINPTKEREKVPGEKRLYEFENIIYNGFSMKPHKFQKGFIEAATKGLAELIVGKKDWLKVGPLLKKQRPGWNESNECAYVIILFH